MPFVENVYKPILFGEANQELIKNYNSEFNASFTEADFLFSNVYRIYKTIDQGIVQASNEFAQFEAFIINKLSETFGEDQIAQDATILGLSNRIRRLDFVEDVAIANPNSPTNATLAGQIQIAVKYTESPINNTQKKELAEAIFLSAGDSTEFLGDVIVNINYPDVNLNYDIKWKEAQPKIVTMAITVTYESTSLNASSVEEIKQNVLKTFAENQGIGINIKTQIYENPNDYRGINAIAIVWTYDGSINANPVIAVAADELPTLNENDITVA